MLNLRLFKTIAGMGIVLLMLGVNLGSASSQTTDEILAIAWSPSGDRIATGHRSGAINIWDGGTGLELYTLQGHSQGVYTIIWKPDGTQLLSTGLDKYAKIWNVTTATELATLEISNANGMLGGAWSLQGDQIYTWGFDASINFYVWDAQTFQFILKDDFGGDTREIVWNPAQTIGALVNLAGQVILVDAQSLEVIRRLHEIENAQGARAGVYKVDWNANGDRLISGSAGGDIRVWDVNTGNILHSMTAMVSTVDSLPTQIVQALRYSNDDAYIYSVAGDGTFRTFDAETGAIIAEANLASSILAADWSPDGTHLAYSGDTGSLSILNRPVANAGVDQIVADTGGNSTELITLDGSSSTDSDGTLVSYDWLENGTSIATGVTPQMELGIGVHTITLVVTDNDGLVDTDEVVITIEGQTCLPGNTLAENDIVGLVNAISVANGTSEPETICLTENGTYTLTAINNGENGLPLITSDITIEGNGATLQRDTSAPNFRFFRVETTGMLTLNNLTLQNGVSNQGGAVENDGGQLTASNVTFTGNSAFTGGAIDNTNGNMTIADSVFNGNSASFGGAIDNDSLGTMTIENSTFTSNSVTDDGGAIHNDGGTLSIASSTFTTNMATRYGGAIDNNSTATLTIASTSFDGNQAVQRGGAINNGGNLTIGDASTFDGNQATVSGWGGAIFNNSTATLTVNDTTFTNNFAQYGGVIRNHGSATFGSGSIASTNSAGKYGGVAYTSGPQFTLTDVEFSGNTSVQEGGAIYTTGTSNVTIESSTISGNSTQARGGAVHNTGSLTITDSNLLNNTAATDGGAIYTSLASTATVHTSCIAGNSSRSVYYSGSNSQDFANNWWGDASGPSGSGPGTGDSINTTNIAFNPFLTAGCPN